MIRATILIITLLTLMSHQAMATNKQANSEVFAELDQGLSSITYTPNNRFIFAYHPFYNPKVKLGERLENGDIVPFPNKDMQQSHDKNGQLKPPGSYFNWVLTARTDGADLVWVLDSGQATPRITPKLVAWNVVTNSLEKVIFLPDGVSLPESQHNDFAISSKHNLIIIADEGIATGPIGDKASLVIVNTQTGESRRVLQGTPSVMPDSSLPMVIDEGTPQARALDLFIGVDGIVLDKAQQWLYFTAVSGQYVHRIDMQYLTDTKLSTKELATHVERYAKKPVNGGLTIDSESNLYLSAIGKRAIGVIPADTRQYREYTHDENMVWPDAVNTGPDGYLYTAAAQLSLAAPLNNGQADNHPPYKIFRFKPLAATVIGR